MDLPDCASGEAMNTLRDISEGYRCCPYSRDGPPPAPGGWVCLPEPGRPGTACGRSSRCSMAATAASRCPWPSRTRSSTAQGIGLVWRTRTAAHLLHPPARSAGWRWRQSRRASIHLDGETVSIGRLHAREQARADEAAAGFGRPRPTPLRHSGEPLAHPARHHLFLWVVRTYGPVVFDDSRVDSMVHLS